ncbi:hypothetical protein F4861DRAFT_503146 [Xylaria intraflava]|nr:hypothetical protein F4861DRAFT_503146 [Xylaria intraflava]
MCLVIAGYLRISCFLRTYALGLSLLAPFCGLGNGLGVFYLVCLLVGCREANSGDDGYGDAFQYLTSKSSDVAMPPLLAGLIFIYIT